MLPAFVVSVVADATKDKPPVFVQVKFGAVNVQSPPTTNSP
jgi:hypothetical protein